MTSSKPKQIKVPVVEYKREILVCPEPPQQTKPDWEKIIWVVATAEDGRKIIGIEEQYYKNLAANTQLALKAIKDRNLIINYLTQCIEDYNNG
jgi:hypothetical protein